MDLITLLPKILPLAVDWALKRAAEIRNQGVTLSTEYIKIAKEVGVHKPEEVRILHAKSIPFPEEPLLRQAAINTGMLGPTTRGLTLGHSIYIIDRNENTRLISHELRHVYQYEQFGSIEAFLAEYLKQIVEFGYLDAPLEIDARNHEVH